MTERAFCEGPRRGPSKNASTSYTSSGDRLTEFSRLWPKDGSTKPRTKPGRDREEVGYIDTRLQVIIHLQFGDQLQCETKKNIVPMGCPKIRSGSLKASPRPNVIRTSRYRRSEPPVERILALLLVVGETHIFESIFVYLRTEHYVARYIPSLCCAWFIFLPQKCSFLGVMWCQ